MNGKFVYFIVNVGLSDYADDADHIAYLFYRINFTSHSEYEAKCVLKYDGVN